MESLLQLLLGLVGIGFLIVVIGFPLLSIFGALFAYIRYHLFGVRTPIIDDLFYRSGRGELTPQPSRLKGITLIAVIISGIYWFFT